MSNPLLINSALPDFATVRLEHFEPAIDALLAESRSLIQNLETLEKPTWQNFALPLEEANDRLNNAWSVISHYNGVLNSEALREIYQRLVAKLTAFQTEFGQNAALYDAYQALADSDDFGTYSPAQRACVEHALRDFRLAGVALPAEQKKRFAEIKKRLSELSTRFSENVLDATQGWSKFVGSEEELEGLPESALSLLAQQARQQGKEQGYLITLDIPSYLPVMTYCANRRLREELYEAYATRASEQGPNAGKWDNSPLITEILQLRQEISTILGFRNYAERSLATKMANDVGEVIAFLEDLAGKSVAMAKREFADLEAFARDVDGLNELENWDVAYYAEQLKQRNFDISQEALKPYFPAPKVISGMFEIVSRLFGIEVRAADDQNVYHDDVVYYEILRGRDVVAGFYLDMYARKDKRGGAWMADCRTKRKGLDGRDQLPVAFLTCNFTPPVGDKPSLLTHDEVTTLFHEFGHGLHHMLTKIDVADVSGIAGVPWDVVELPSQFLENWCWQPEAIPMISGHFETGEPLPPEMLEKMLAAKHFQSAMQMVRQLEFALFDFLLHRDFDGADFDVLGLLDQVRDRVSVKKPPVYSRTPQSFSHIFAGGYAAGYYSYKWAEVLAADAFSRFEEEGVFNVRVGEDFRREILEVGGSRDAHEMFVAFRGRGPSVDALLRHAGILGEVA